MPRTVEYRRDAVLKYAEEWALKRNPRYLDFERLGGDCTNFASQCIYAGSGIMNYTPVMGWYYKNGYDKSPSWTGVPYLYNFLVNNESVGPFAVETGIEEVEPGDIVQLGTPSLFYHSPVIVSVEGGRVYVAAHTFDVYMRPLDSYAYDRVRFLHIKGVRVW